MDFEKNFNILSGNMKGSKVKSLDIEGWEK